MTSAATKAPRRRRRPEEARAEILAAAERLLRERPSTEVTISAVMAETELTREAFYAYFRDRYELITTLVGPLRAELDQQVEAMGAGDGELGDDGRRALAGVAHLYHRHGKLLRALLEASAHDAEAMRAWREFVEPPTRAICERIEREIASGAMRRFEVEPFVHSLVPMNLATFFAELVDDPGADVDAVVDRLHTIWIRTLDGFR